MELGLSKEMIQHLVEKYIQAKDAGELGNYTEEDTKKDFILPLFEALGWDTSNRNEVSSEESIKSAGRVDYGFYLNNRAAFYLEAKPLKADLNREDYANQAIRYSWNRGVTWAVLTDFESIKIFNSENISEHLYNKLVFEIPYTQYIERFDQLWNLSKEAFEKNNLEVYARSIGKLQQKVPVSELLYKDLNESRAILTRDLSKWNEGVSPDLIDEGVQKLLDRLLFLRVAEDRGVEPPTLIPLVRAWENSGNKNQVPLYTSMISKFRELDETYNSNLFSPHPFEEWEEYSNATQQVIKILYGKPGYYEYDFKLIPADILGNVYENYLGYKLSQSQKGLSIDKDSKKRKEQGIYYTPTYIVDYIVESALKPVLDKCESIGDLKKIKILDPACGSGSFLIKALELVNEKYKEFGAPGDEITKLIILKDNIYGVDLDAQAVDITRLNLIINCFDRKMKLSSLSGNIKCGNSLISGTDEELNKYFGENYGDKMPFQWKEEFPEVFKQGGFDVIIGNPPYVSITGIEPDLRRIYEQMYRTAVGRFDLFILFIEKAIDILRNGGTCGFIVPNKYLVNDQSEKSRKAILDCGNVKSILFTEEQVFNSASVNSVVLVYKKNKDKSNCKIDEYIKNNINTLFEVPNEVFENDSSHRFIISRNEKSNSLFEKIKNNSICLGDIGEVRDGIVAGRIKDLLFHKDIKNEFCKPLLFGEDVKRYSTHFSQNYVDYRKDFMLQQESERAHGKRIGLWMRDEIIFNRPKILTRKTADMVIAVFDEENYYYEQTLHSTYISNKNYSPLYILGLLNSTLFRYYYRSVVNQKGTIFPQVRISLLKSLPIKEVPYVDQEVLSEFVQKILDLNKVLDSIIPNSEKWNSIKLEIREADKKIDEEVYKLYDLTSDEIKIVEESTKPSN